MVVTLVVATQSFSVGLKKNVPAGARFIPVPVKFGSKIWVLRVPPVVPADGVKLILASEGGKRVLRAQRGRTSIAVISADVAVNPSSATVMSPVPFETTKNPVPVSVPEVTVAKYVFGCVVATY